VDYKILGKRIKKERLKRDLTQVELAEEVNVSESHISLIERGYRVPRVDTLLKMAQRLGVSVDYLLDNYVESSDDLDKYIKQIFGAQDEKTKNMTIKILKAIADDYDN